MAESNPEQTEETSRREFMRSSAVTGVAATGIGSELAWLTQNSGNGPDIDKTFLLGGRTEAWEGFAPQSISGIDNPTLNLTAGNTYRLLWQNLDGAAHNFQIRDASGNPMEALIPLEIEQSAVSQLFERAQGQSSLTNISVGNVTNLPGDAPITNETGGNATTTMAAANTTTAAETDTDTNATTANATTGQPDSGGSGINYVQTTEIVVETGAVQGVQFTATEEMAQYICVIHPATMIADIEVSSQ